MNTLYMLLFSFVLITPEGPRDEVIHVYSKHFETEQSCKETLESWGWFIKGSSTQALNDMLKEGHEVKLKHVKCVPQPKTSP